MRTLGVGEMFTATEFKDFSVAQQRKAIRLMYERLNVGDANAVRFFVDECAGDLLEETAQLVLAFDVWYVVSVVYDVEIPQDVLECIAEGQDSKHWRRLINRHGLPWNSATKAELSAVGIVGLI